MNDDLAELDDAAIERLLAGDVAPDDAPDGWSAVAGLLHAASAVEPGEVPDAAFLQELVGAAAGGSWSRAAGSSWSRADDCPVVARRRIGVAAAVMALFLGAGTAAAAAGGHLPGPVQSVVHDVAGAVGIDLPDRGETTDDDGDDLEQVENDSPAATTADTDGVPGTDAPGRPDSPGRSEDAPGQDGTTGRPTDPGRSEDAPGQDGTTGRPTDPGRSEDAPGQDGTTGRPADAGQPADPGRPADPGQPGPPPSHGRPATTTTAPPTTTTTTAPTTTTTEVDDDQNGNGANSGNNGNNGNPNPGGGNGNPNPGGGNGNGN